MISAYGYQWKRRRFGGIYATEYYKAKERENFTAQQWQEYSQKQLSQILLHAVRHVPFYKQKFKREGLGENLLKKISVENIHTLPTLEKEELRKYGTNILLSNTKEKHGQFFRAAEAPAHLRKFYFH